MVESADEILRMLYRWHQVPTCPAPRRDSKRPPSGLEPPPAPEARSSSCDACLSLTASAEAVGGHHGDGAENQEHGDHEDGPPGDRAQERLAEVPERGEEAARGDLGLDLAEGQGLLHGTEQALAHPEEHGEERHHEGRGDGVGHLHRDRVEEREREVGQERDAPGGQRDGEHAAGGAHGEGGREQARRHAALKRRLEGRGDTLLPRRFGLQHWRDDAQAGVRAAS
eukprot:CAMPEP_0206022756 /NCGR_PEP_ID=MMETSP1464-20131121/35233_1 /ASSEMBLY_ACC=CAM_ASM_001124 /TAXON_ID=119497 /ORGANISM="Exanthemachrysis gayraliae, Strain RCC1523" /LENGTH=225 /DNA_ID=CAMNT_0053396727 /DNA_START=106 /DNA_END=784 /DNA_ORIENTATION=+